MAYKVFVDGSAGTTGLKINERLKSRTDLEIMLIPEEKRKDLVERKKYLNEADVVFLCLPDAAAKEAVALIDNSHTKVIDASTAHRVAEGWTYGLPELGKDFREKIRTSARVANPGCYATGFNILIHPLVKKGLLPADYPVSCHALSGYSGGGKSLIEEYEAVEKSNRSLTPCFYALGLNHKHLPEMQAISGLDHPPLFTPIVANYYQGMTVAVPIHLSLLKKKYSIHTFHDFYVEYYEGCSFVKAMPMPADQCLDQGFLGALACNDTNNIEIFVFGNDDQALLVSRLDNLGKGASGAAVQNMNIMLGLEEHIGL